MVWNISVKLCKHFRIFGLQFLVQYDAYLVLENEKHVHLDICVVVISTVSSFTAIVPVVVSKTRDGECVHVFIHLVENYICQYKLGPAASGSRTSSRRHEQRQERASAAAGVSAAAQGSTGGGAWHAIARARTRQLQHRVATATADR